MDGFSAFMVVVAVVMVGGGILFTLTVGRKKTK